MDPISMISSFVFRVLGYVKAGVDWRHGINKYELDKRDTVALRYKFKIFPLDFISVRRSQFAGDKTIPGSRGDYAQTVIKVKDIYPFILNAHSSAVFVRSFRKNNPSVFDNVKLNVAGGYFLGTDKKYHIIDANHYGYDKPGTRGIITFYTEPGNAAENRKAHSLHETGKAYALAPNVKPNLITEMQVLVKGKNYIYGAILLLIIVFIAINKKNKK